MIIIDDLHMPISISDARDILQRETDSFGCFYDLDRVLEIYAYTKLNLEFRQAAWLEWVRNPNFKFTQRNLVLNFLKNDLEVPAYKLTSEDGKETIDASTRAKLIGDHTLSDEVRNFITLYNDLCNFDQLRSSMDQYLSLPVCKGESYEGHRMVVAHPTWNILATSRFSSSNPNIQNIDRRVKDIQTAPAGWAIVYSDSSQIEPKITYSYFIKDPLMKKLILLYDDAYLAYVHYCTISPEELEAERNGAEIQRRDTDEEFLAKRKIIKVLALAGMYDSGDLASIDPVLGPAFQERIGNNPYRKQYVYEVEQKVRNGQETFFGAFGTPIRPQSNQKYNVGGRGWLGHLKRCGINNPVQATAAELQRISIYHAHRYLDGWGHICSYVHDEGAFYVPASMVEECAPVLQGFLSYKVKDWIPISSDLVVGRKESKLVTD